MNQDLELAKIYNELSEIEKECLKEKFKDMRTEDIIKENELNFKLEYLRRTYKNKLISINSENTEFNKNKEKCDADLIKEMVEQNIKKSIIKENIKSGENEKLEKGNRIIKCQKCKSDNVELTSSENVGVIGRLNLLLGTIGLTSILMFFLGMVGLIIGVFFIIVAFFISLDPRKQKIYHCKTCNAVFKKGWGQ